MSGIGRQCCGKSLRSSCAALGPELTKRPPGTRQIRNATRRLGASLRYRRGFNPPLFSDSSAVPRSSNKYRPSAPATAAHSRPACAENLCTEVSAQRTIPTGFVVQFRSLQRLPSRPLGTANTPSPVPKGCRGIYWRTSATAWPQRSLLSACAYQKGVSSVPAWAWTAASSPCYLGVWKHFSGTCHN
jgi:hypothetical protein